MTTQPAEQNKVIWNDVKKLVVVCEPALESKLVALVSKGGGKLMTVVTARGRGLLGDSGADLSGELIRLECFCPSPVAERIVQGIQSRFFAKYDVFVAVSEAQVLRPDKF